MQSHQEGLTKTYNHFHNPADTSPDIAELRRLHMEMDEAVVVAYGWHDLVVGAPHGREEHAPEPCSRAWPAPTADSGLGLGHGFHATKQGIRYTISEAARREVLDRLLELNHQRHAEEQAEQAAKSTKAPAQRGPRKPKPAAAASGQLDAFAILESEAPAGTASVLEYLQTHPGWHSKDAILTVSGFPENRWHSEIKSLLDSGQVE